jgi:hypothetical protein
MTDPMKRLTLEELTAEAATPLPAKEVMSLLDLNVDIDLALDLAAPIDLAIAANANVAAPIDAAVSANILSFSSLSQAVVDQQTSILQTLSGEAIADAPQTAFIDQSNDVIDAGSTAAASPDATTDAVSGTTAPVEGTTDAVSGTTASLGDATEAVSADTDPVEGVVDTVSGTTAGATETVTDATNSVLTAADTVTTGNIFQDGLLNVNVVVHLDADFAAPIAGAVAANANVAAPIDAAVSANILSFNSQSFAVATQTAIIQQELNDVVAHATAAQDAEIHQ